MGILHVNLPFCFQRILLRVLFNIVSVLTQEEMPIPYPKLPTMCEIRRLSPEYRTISENTQGSINSPRGTPAGKEIELRIIESTI